MINPMVYSHEIYIDIHFLIHQNVIIQLILAQLLNVKVAKLVDVLPL